MTETEVLALNNGLYHVFWKGGGQSLASVGVTRSGYRWLAPINWVIPDNDGSHWDSVSHVIPIDPYFLTKE
jgi:hypothetical protein